MSENLLVDISNVTFEIGTQTLYNEHDVADGLIITDQSSTKQALISKRNTPTCPSTSKNYVLNCRIHSEWLWVTEIHT